MRRLIIPAAALIAATGFAATASGGVRDTYSHSYYSAAKRCGGRQAVGRNVRRAGSTLSDGRRVGRSLYRDLAAKLDGMCPLVSQRALSAQPTSAQSAPAAATAAPSTSAASSGGGGGGGGFAACIRQKENSGSYSGSDGAYSGAYQFDQQTWSAAWGGHPPTASAGDASPAQQDQAFQRWYPSHPTAWPNTGPACGG